jgi:CBS domain-containing protein
MAGRINEVMTADPKTVGSGESLTEAARIMRDADIGDVVVVDDGQVAGILTDRDIAVRAVAEGRDPDSTTAGEVCTSDLVTLEPDQSTEDAIKAMRDQDVRRLPVVQDGRPVGIVSLGDLAVDRDPDSALADISASSPNN